MDIKSWFKQGDENFDQSRRRFIRDAAGLAALTVAAAHVPSIFQSTRVRLATADLERQILNGTVEGQVFYIDRPIVLDLPGTTIRNCQFIATSDLPYFVYVAPEASHCIITNCQFYGRDYMAGQGARVPLAGWVA